MTQKKNDFFSQTVVPFLVLFVICLVVALLLGMTNDVTAPVIEANKQAAALRDRQELLPQATGFSELTGDFPPEVRSVFADDGGSGVIVTAAKQGYGGLVTVTIALDKEGKILGMKADTSTETKGVGTKASSEDFLSDFVGLGAGDALPDALSGATYSTSAVIASVESALLTYQEMGVNVQ